MSSPRKSADLPTDALAQWSIDSKDDEAVLERLIVLQTMERKARDEIKPSHTLDAKYWTAAAKLKSITINIYNIEMKQALRRWKKDAEDEADRSWWASPEARQWVNKVKAATVERQLYERQSKRVLEGGSAKRSWLAFFNTSKLGLSLTKIGVGRRTRAAQSRFKEDLVRAYDAGVPHPKKPKTTKHIYDIATGRKMVPQRVIAVHVVPHSLGPEVLIAIFGDDVENELDSIHNGLLLADCVEKAFDDGAIAIVPNLPDDPSTADIEEWETRQPKDYRWRVIDDEAAALDATLMDEEAMEVRDLDGKPLFFQGTHRPRARYLYYTFVVAQLKLAWRLQATEGTASAALKLKNGLGRGLWATKGRYMRRSFMMALADEVGDDTDFVNQIPPSRGDDEENEADGTGLIGIAAMIQHSKRDSDTEDDEDD